MVVKYLDDSEWLIFIEGYCPNRKHNLIMSMHPYIWDKDKQVAEQKAEEFRLHLQTLLLTDNYRVFARNRIPDCVDENCTMCDGTPVTETFLEFSNEEVFQYGPTTVGEQDSQDRLAISRRCLYLCREEYANECEKDCSTN